MLISFVNSASNYPYIMHLLELVYVNPNFVMRDSQPLKWLFHFMPECLGSFTAYRMQKVV